jgi:hypothetical protein
MKAENGELYRVPESSIPRLEYLASFLRTVPEERFYMRQYWSRDEESLDPWAADIDDCDTSACSVGWYAWLTETLPREAENDLLGRFYRVTPGGLELWYYLFGPNNPHDPVEASDRVLSYLKEVS